MNTSMKTRVASSIAACALVGAAVPASAAEPAMPDQQMMQGQAQGSGAIVLIICRSGEQVAVFAGRRAAQLESGRRIDPDLLPHLRRLAA